jgi:hypothetical protein
MAGKAELTPDSDASWPSLSTGLDKFYVARTDCDEGIIEADIIPPADPSWKRRPNTRSLVATPINRPPSSPEAMLYTPPPPNRVQFPPGRGSRSSGYTDLPPYDGYDDDFNALREEYLRQPSYAGSGYGETVAAPRDVQFQIRKTMAGDTVIFISRELGNRIGHWLHISRRGLIFTILFVLLLLFGRLPDFIEVGLRILF